MSYQDDSQRNNIPDDKLNEILGDSKILTSNIRKNENFINISEIPKNLNSYSQESNLNNYNSNIEPNKKNDIIDGIKKEQSLNLKNIIQIPSFFKWKIETEQKNIDKNLSKLDNNTNKTFTFRPSFTKDDINRSVELRKILFSSIFAKPIQENFIETKKESSTFLSGSKSFLSSNSSNKGATIVEKLEIKNYVQKKEIDSFKDEKNGLIFEESQIITKIFLNKFEKLFTYFDLIKVDIKKIKSEVKNVTSSIISNTDYDSFIFDLCRSYTNYPNSNAVALISGRNNIEYGYEKETENIFILEKINDHKYKDVEIKQLNEFVEKQPISSSINSFEMMEKKRKRPKKKSKKNEYPIKNTKNKLIKKLMTSKLGDKKQYFLNEFNFYGSSLKKLLYAPDLHEDSIIRAELLENIFKDNQLKDILKIKNKSKKFEKIDNLGIYKNTEYTLIFHSEQKKELGVYKIHLKEHGFIYIIYQYYSIIKKYIELLNKNFYSHGSSKSSRAICYKISFFINKCNDFTKKTID